MDFRITIEDGHGNKAVVEKDYHDDIGAGTHYEQILHACVFAIAVNYGWMPSAKKLRDIFEADYQAEKQSKKLKKGKK